MAGVNWIVAPNPMRWVLRQAWVVRDDLVSNTYAWAPGADGQPRDSESRRLRMKWHDFFDTLVATLIIGRLVGLIAGTLLASV